MEICNWKKFIENVILVNIQRDPLHLGAVHKLPFNEQTVLDHLNTKLVRYSDPHCTVGKDAQNSETFENWTFTCLIFKWLK